MPRRAWRALACLLILGALSTGCLAQRPLGWDEVRERFRTNNPTLIAGRASVEETRAQEITAYLRPNPDFTMTADGFQVGPNDGVWRPLSGVVLTPGVSYLHERQRKRELRRDSAQKATGISELSQADLERNLLFNLRNAFVQTLQQKAVLALARENLSYWDRVLELSRERFRAGDISQADLDRLELQRVQYQSDVLTAEVNLRTAKIQLLTMMNDRTAVEQLDVTESYDFTDQIIALSEFRRIALDARPDLRAAVQAIEKARTDHQLAVANGSTDPTFNGWFSHNPSFSNPFANNTIGGSVSIPIRLNDRNQGEKLRTQLEIGRSERLRDASEAQVYSDVDSAYAMLANDLLLLRPYKANYLQQAARVRETVSFAYQRGGASLIDFLQAQQDYRTIQLNYLNLVGSYLAAANQLNLAVGREVLP
jgi:cobalt-zinc-cadmium efflux system outer membrane protein